MSFNDCLTAARNKFNGMNKRSMNESLRIFVTSRLDRLTFNFTPMASAPAVLQCVLAYANNI